MPRGTRRRHRYDSLVTLQEGTSVIGCNLFILTVSIAPTTTPPKRYFQYMIADNPVHVAQLPIPPQHPDANNPFAAPAAPPGPPGGVQDVGEFGPYYIYENDKLVEIPDINIVRDYDYAYKVTEQDFRRLIADGWCNAFESSAFLHERALKSRAIVVLSDNGWMTGDKTNYTWCVRIDVTVEAVEGVSMGNVETETESGDAKELLHYGRHVLWPIAPHRASNARERWKYDETLCNSRLVLVYVPSDKPFDYKAISKHTVMEGAMPSTLRLVMAVVPLEEKRKSHVTKSTNPLRQFEWPDKDWMSEQPLDPRFTSTVVSVGLAKRACSVMSFTAHANVGWNALNEDLQEHIWENMASECIDTYGECESRSLRTWCSLRRVCGQSKRVVDRLTTRFMHRAVDLANAVANMQLVDAIRLRDLLVPRGINPHALKLEINHSVACNAASSLWQSVHAYMRIRSGKLPTEKAPAPVSRRNTPSKPAAMALPEPKAARSSLRLGIKRSAQETSPSAAVALSASSSSLPSMYAVVQYGEKPVEYTHIRFKLRIPENPSKKPKQLSIKASGKAKMKRVPPEAPSPPNPAAKIQLSSWVCCSDSACGKWRRLQTVPGLGDYLSVQDLPKRWVCDMHPSGITCRDPEEAMDEGEVCTASFESTDKKEEEGHQYKRACLAGGSDGSDGRLRVNTRRTRSAGK